MLFSKNYYRIRGLCLLGCIFILPICTFAQKSPIATETSVTNPYDALRYTLVVIAALMALVIGVLGNAVIVTSKIFWEKQKETRDIQKKDSILAKGAILMLAMACSHGVFAQEVKKNG